MRDAQPSTTAEMVCSWRALESLLPPERRIVHDPQARRYLRGLRGGLVDACALVPPRLLRWGLRAADQALSGVIGFVLARHRLIDELLEGQRWEQVVLLGAGYDTRSERLELGGARVFEVDHPATAARKRALTPAQDAVGVTVDFTRQSLRERLLEHGFESGRRTFWSWEGVTMYLDEASVRATLDLIQGLSGAGSLLVFDVWCPPRGRLSGFLQRTLPARAFRLLYEEPLTFGWPRDQLANLLADHGLRLREQIGARELVGRYQRGRAVLDLTNMVMVVAEAG